jgi:transcriptional regulator with XRE-family HTH domain
VQGQSSPKGQIRKSPGYIPEVPRKLSTNRPKQGARLLALRTDAGFSQAELASLADEPQQNIALWETSDKPPRSDAIPKLAKALGVRIEDLFVETVKPNKPIGPTGKLRKLFESISTLPRRQQEKIVDFVRPVVEQYKREAS